MLLIIINLFMIAFFYSFPLDICMLQSCGKDVAIVEKDTSRVRYLAPEEAIEYGLIDKVLYPEELRVQAPKFIDML